MMMRCLIISYFVVAVQQNGKSLRENSDMASHVEISVDSLGNVHKVNRVSMIPTGPKVHLSMIQTGQWEPTEDVDPVTTTGNVKETAPADETVLPMACSESLLNNNVEITASSVEDGASARWSIPADNPYRAWVPSEVNNEQWLQWKFNGEYDIRFLQISGKHDSAHHGGLDNFKIEYLDGAEWVWYVSAKDQEEGAQWTTLTCDADAPNMGMIVFDPPIRSNEVRIRPTTFPEVIAVRADLRGCPAEDVVSAGMEFGIDIKDLFPATFESKDMFRSELTTRIVNALQCQYDQITVASIVGNGDGQVDVVVIIMPKANSPTPREIYNNLKAAMEDQGSALSKWMDNLEQTQSATSQCISVDCGTHGHCAGGKCFCFDGYGGPLCDRSLNPNVQNDKAAGGLADGVDEDVLSMRPLPIIKDAVRLPGEEEPPQALTAEQLKEKMEAFYQKIRKASKELEGGFSGAVGRHPYICVIFPSMASGTIFLIFLYVVYAKLFRDKKKWKGEEEGEEGEEEGEEGEEEMDEASEG